MNFDDLTIGQLKKLTEEYDKLEIENKLLKIKYPNKLKQLENPETIQSIIDRELQHD